MPTTAITGASFGMTLGVQVGETGDFPGVGTLSAPLTYAVTTAMPTGTASGQVNIAWWSGRSLVGSADETLDLRALTDVFGNTVTLNKIKVLLIIADDANGDNIQVGGAGANAWSAAFDANGDNIQVGGAGANAWSAAFDANTSYLVVPPGGRMALEASKAGYTVDGTHNLFKVTNASGSPINYAIAILGTQ